MKPIKVLALSGIRSEYDVIYPVLRCLQRDERFDVAIAISGTHLSEWHGRTALRIEQDGFRVADRIDSLFNTDRPVQRAKGCGILAYALAQTVEREAPDFLYVEGDREECLAAALVGNYMGVLVVHSGGGDTVFGNTDDPVRFAVSKLAHIHFPICEAYGRYLVNLGEDPERVFVVGNPSLDNLRTVPILGRQELAARLWPDLAQHDYLLVLEHPYSAEAERSYEHMTATLTAVDSFCRLHDLFAVGIHPNSDPGAAGVLQAITDFSASPRLRFFKTLERELFLNLFRGALVLVGNSSMGILEAPFYGLPVINVGERQRGRINAGNVEFVPHEQQAILRALTRACHDTRHREQVRANRTYYGDGHSAALIRDVLLSIDLNERWWHLKGTRRSEVPGTAP